MIMSIEIFVDVVAAMTGMKKKRERQKKKRKTHIKQNPFIKSYLVGHIQINTITYYNTYNNETLKIYTIYMINLHCGSFNMFFLLFFYQFDCRYDFLFFFNYFITFLRVEVRNKKWEEK